MERQLLTIMNYVDGTNDTPFHDAENPITITEYTYSTTRMGSTQLTATLRYPVCLDDEWDGTQYVEFRGERYFISGTPSSSKDNEDARYSHSLTFRAERDIVLNNVYFYDAVSEESTGDDKYKSNSTKVVFFGDIHEFVARLNESLDYSGVGYTAVVDEGVTSEAKLMSFEDQFFFNVLQEIYNTYGLPFYFAGKVIHIGYTDNAITHTFRYGFDNELLSIKKDNANYRIVNRCTGTGSSDNIPYYYPNSSPRGTIGAKAAVTNTGIVQDDINIVDMEKFYSGMDLTTKLTYKNMSEATINDAPDEAHHLVFTRDLSTIHFTSDVTVHSPSAGIGHLRMTLNVMSYPGYPGECKAKSTILDDHTAGMSFPYGSSSAIVKGIWTIENDIYINFEREGYYSFSVDIAVTCVTRSDGYAINVKDSYEIFSSPCWYKDDDPLSDISDVGLELTGTPQHGDVITQERISYITPSETLLPPIYRDTDGAERFYNAENNTYTDPDTGEKYIFENEYKATDPKEIIMDFPDIKPTIKGAENAAGQRMDQILDIAFDTDDSDDVDEEGNYLHPYFFVKLPKFDGDWGFNLFDHSIEDDEMTLSMTSGDCGACEFKIAVGEETQKNLVQVDGAGNLLRDSNGNVRCGRPGNEQTAETPQDRQNDTSAYEVWLALEKDTSTYGQLMPNAGQGIRPKEGDSFVLLNIKMPDAYVYRAENLLKEAIIRYMSENNSEKFNFSITFSRIYLAEHPEVASQLNENARIQLEYNGKTAEFYISQYTCKCVDDEALPEVSVTLQDTITVNRTTLQNSMDALQRDIQEGIGNIDFLRMGLRYFLRKDVDDESRGIPKFLSGVEFGQFTSGLLGSGAAVRIDPDTNVSHMEVDFLSVRRRADFTTISVQELKQIGGQLIISPAAMVCSRVEETETAYRCYFDTGNEVTEAGIYNQFVVGDQARMQQFNLWGSRYYWRLVTAVGDDYIDLSKTDCDDDSDIPQSGDNIVQLGNRNDTTRQSAQIFSCFGENAPSYIMYNGISSYDLTGKNIVGIIYNPSTGEPQMYCYGAMFFGDRDIDADDANYITYQQKEGDTKKKLYISADIKIGAGSSGLSNLEEWSSAQESITDAEQTAQEALDKAQEAKDYIDNTLPSELQEINKRLDGVVENWFYKYTPTRENEPALTWITDGTEADHTGDTFTNIQEYVDDETTPDAGKSWRWALVDGQYTWTPIADSDAVKALQQAARAQDTADQKRRAFVTTPYTPYDVGDIWIQGPNGEIMRCITARASGNYDASDWDKASKYTDDTAANKANDRISDIEYLKEIFGKPTVDSEGAILAKLLAVKDDGGNVVAGLNASDSGQSTGTGGHGRLLFFAGADNVNSLSTSKTRIYEDGHIVSTSVDLEGKISASSGKIGGFSIDDFDLVNNEDSYSSRLSAAAVQLRNNGTRNYTSAILLQTVTDGTSGRYNNYRVAVQSEYNGSTVSGSNPQNIGLYLDVSGAKYENVLGTTYGNFAVRCINGMFSGLRPLTRFFYQKSGSLTSEDFFCLVWIEPNYHSTINLPTNPENGQTIFMFKDGGGSLTVNADKEFLRIGYGVQNELGIGGEFHGIILFVYTEEDNRWWTCVITRN